MLAPFEARTHNPPCFIEQFERGLFSAEQLWTVAGTPVVCGPHQTRIEVRKAAAHPTRHRAGFGSSTKA